MQVSITLHFCTESNRRKKGPYSLLSLQMARYRNVCWTLNNPVDMVMFDETKMDYLVYQEEFGDSGNYHFQGYCEFSYAMNLAPAKALLGGDTVHLERRRGSQAEAIGYCKDEKKRLAATEPYEDGEPRTQGKRMDLEGFKNEVMQGANLRELLDDHWGVIARYPKFYQTLKLMNRPKRTQQLEVTLLIGDTGLGKTRYVEDKYGEDEDFWRLPLNNGTMWFDTFDGHTKVLLDDFTGKSSHFALCNLLQLLDVYSILVPTKGGFTWWMPNEVFITSNIYPKDWYDWSTRAEQYKALARRFTKVLLYYVPLSGADCGYIEQDTVWWEENKPDSVLY